MTASYNKEKGLDVKDKLDQREIVSAQRYPDSKVVAKIQESPNEARLRWQREVSAKSFHSSIIGSAKNHSQVTAYDVAIGSGKASSDPLFYAYLCAVADWRVKDLKCLVSCDHIPRRSMALFRAKAVLDELIGGLPPRSSHRLQHIA